jgi:hypothetical protein
MTHWPARPEATRSTAKPLGAMGFARFDLFTFSVDIEVELPIERG